MARIWRKEKKGICGSLLTSWVREAIMIYMLKQSVQSRIDYMPRSPVSVRRRRLHRTDGRSSPGAPSFGRNPHVNHTSYTTV